MADPASEIEHLSARIASELQRSVDVLTAYKAGALPREHGQAGSEDMLLLLRTLATFLVREARSRRVELPNPDVSICDWIRQEFLQSPKRP